MDSCLYEAIVTNDKETFISLIKVKKQLLEQRTANTLNTVLHLAARLGYVDLVKEIITLQPEMIGAQNEKLDTPLHEACRQGNYEIVVMLLGTYIGGCKFNSENQTALYVACNSGHTNVVKLLLKHTYLLGLEDDVERTCLHAAVSKGHTDIIRHLLRACPSLTRRYDMNGCNPLHYACANGHSEITKMLLNHDPGLAFQFDNNGCTPLHLAAINGNITILKLFLAMVPAYFSCLTKDGETVLHLTVKFVKFCAFVCLAEVFSDSHLFLLPDRFGNTILHSAIFRGHYHLAEYIINGGKIEVNQQNQRGHTALDILNHAGTNSEVQSLRDMVKKAGGLAVNELFQAESIIPSPRDVLEQEFDWLVERGSGSKYSSPGDHDPYGLTEQTSAPIMDSLQIRSEIKNNDASEPEPSKETEISLANTSMERRKELIRMFNHQKVKQDKVYREALQNARNTITLVAILIDTVTFTAGINPPGGLYQEGVLKGKSILGRTTTFKIFAISNHIALFTSLSIVLVQVSIIPFRTKPLMKLLVAAHKLMWVAVSFMTVAYIAGSMVVVPRGKRDFWTFEALVAICGGSLVVVFIFLGVILVQHWLRKSKFRKLEKPLNDDKQKLST